METFTSINEWQRRQFPGATHVGILRHFYEELGEFSMAKNYEDRRREAVDMILVLCAYLDDGGNSTQEAIDWKMARNRERSWKILPDGTGRHV